VASSLAAVWRLLSSGIFGNPTGGIESWIFPKPVPRNAEMNHAEAFAKLVLESVIPGIMIYGFTNMSSRMANAILNCVTADGSSGTTLCRSCCMDRFEKV
jgi:hypothetical protein